jgi:MFS family permease
MERITLNSLSVQAHREERTTYREKRLRWLLNGGLIGLFGGALAPVLGSLLTALSWLVGNNSFGYSSHRLGSIFLISTIPLLIIAAFCLDAYEKRGKRIDFDW